MKHAAWKDIGKYRNELFGLSIISIILFHYFEGVAGAEYASHTLRQIAKVFNGAIGSVGVDIFLFLSGFGIWYSLSKQPKLLDFYVKRIRRVVIPYFVMGGVFWIAKGIFISHVTAARFIYDFTLLSFWGSGVRTFWYISFICVLYLVSPAVFRAGRKGYVAMGIASILLAGLLLCTDRETFDHVEIAILRVPIYFVGMYCAELASEQKSINSLTVAVIVLAVPAKIAIGLIDFPLSRLFNAGYALLLIVLYLQLRNMISLNDRIKGFLKKTGELSLELYIVHVAIRNIMGTLGLKTANLLIYCLCIALSVPMAMVFSRLQALLLKKAK